MSPQKLAAQVTHATCQLKLHRPPDKVIVLMASLTKFNAIAAQAQEEDWIHYIQKDLGLTEVEKGTQTVIAYVD